MCVGWRRAGADCGGIVGVGGADAGVVFDAQGKDCGRHYKPVLIPGLGDGYEVASEEYGCYAVYFKEAFCQRRTADGLLRTRKIRGSRLKDSLTRQEL